MLLGADGAMGAATVRGLIARDAAEVCFAGFRFGCAGIAIPAYLGQPFLCERAGLFDGQFPVLAQGGLAALAGVRPVLEHEYLAACRGDPAQEAGCQRIAQFDGLRLGCAASTADFVSLNFAMTTPWKDPVPRSLAVRESW